MKKIFYLVLFVMVAVLANAAVNTEYYAESPKILVSLASQDPDPVEPGKIVEVSFKLDNQGALADDVTFDIIPEYPFSLVPGEVSMRNIGTLGTSQNAARTVFVKYRIRVDQNAVDGSHEIKVRYKLGSFESWSTVDNLKIKVQSLDAILGVDKVTTIPEIVAPGFKAKLSISLRNYATSLLKDVKVTLTLGESSNEETPFSPVGSTNEKVISNIDPQSTALIDFNLLVDPDAKSKTYKVPLKIQYSDTLNKNYSKTNTISLVVGAEPDVSVYIDTASVYSAGKTGEVSVKIVNKGLTDIKFLNVKLEKGEYSVISPSEVYIGNIDSDDYETVDFRINVEKTNEKRVILPLTIEYKDSNNQDYIRKENLDLPLYTNAEAKRLGLAKGRSTFSVLLILLVVAALTFGVYRFWKRRRK